MIAEAIDKILTDILWGTPHQYLAVFSRDEIPDSTLTNQHTSLSTRFPSEYVANTVPSALLFEH